MRRIAGIALLSVLVAAVSSSTALSADRSQPPTMVLKGEGALFGSDAEDVEVQVDDNPLNRVDAWAPRPAGTKRWMTIDYGPYTIHPGSDLSRMDVEIAGQNGYAVGFEPIVVDATGKPYSSHDIHIHHAHWYWLDPEQEGLHRWFYGTGEERTQGSLWPIAQRDPRFKDGLRYGVELNQGDRLGFLSMLHNKTADAKVVYLRVRIQYVYGTHDEIEKAKGWDFHHVRPTLIGTTFNVPRTGGVYDFPLDANNKKSLGPHSNYHNPVGGTEVVPGVGQVVTMPFSGTVIVGAGHMHPGGKEVVVSNMGRKNDPCPNDGDRFPGVTAVHSRNITRNNVFGSSEYQMGLTQKGWRMYVRKGDRLAINGVYDARRYSFPDAMSYFGFYTDMTDKPSASQTCEVELLDKPNASRDEIAWTTPNQKWQDHHPIPTCKKCDRKAKRPEPGAETNLVHIAAFLYLPGQEGVEGAPAGPPVVTKGDELTFVNEDYALGGVRHSVTSCRAPCNGNYTANYPQHDGDFHSGALGYTWQETYINAKDEPRWSLDTGKMKPGYYTYYCQLHPWMRGGFYVQK
jgi:plastocyanin